MNKGRGTLKSLATKAFPLNKTTLCGLLFYVFDIQIIGSPHKQFMEPKMAKSFKSLNDATDAVFLYLENSISVHDITSKYEVNTFRLYEVVDGQTWSGALRSALHKLETQNPIAFSKLPVRAKLRRGNFGSQPKTPSLFG